MIRSCCLRPSISTRIKVSGGQGLDSIRKMLPSLTADMADSKSVCPVRSTVTTSGSLFLISESMAEPFISGIRMSERTKANPPSLSKTSSPSTPLEARCSSKSFLKFNWNPLRIDSSSSTQRILLFMLKVFFWIGGQTCGGTRVGWLEYDLSNPKQFLIKSNLSLLASRWEAQQGKE